MRFLALLLLTVLASGAWAAEEIGDFSSRIVIDRDGRLDITETIPVQAEGRNIRRGIYRDFPTLYRSRFGLRVEVPFRVIEILRDGKPEPWRSERLKNGVRIYIGDANVLLPHGPTTYTIRYATDQQLGFFADHDELYWNVTGNGWAFPIRRASVCVDLPPGTGVRAVEAFTGPAGSKETSYRSEPRGGCDVFVETTRELNPNEGLTIVVTWPKGFVAEPGLFNKWRTLVLSNLGIVLGIVGVGVTFAYFFTMWVLVGRDPERGVIVPLFAPPEGMSPQDVRFVNELGTCDQTSFAAAVLDLAVKDQLTIEKNSTGTYSLENLSAGSLDPEAAALKAEIFKDGSPLELVSRNHATVRAARAWLAKSVKKKNGALFARNTRVWIIGIAVALVPLAISLRDANEPGGVVFLMVWLSIWTIGCAALSTSAVTEWRKKSFGTAVATTLFAIPFLAGWVLALAMMLVLSVSPWVCAVYVAAVLLCVIFQRLLKRPSVEGQLIRDQILGFRRYLSVAEADRLNLENPPERTPELFERFLPYALALDVSQEWAEQFEDVLTASGYEPTWQRGADVTAFAPTAFAAGVTGALVGAVASASTAPGSSSGSSSGGGGGGSSGGGGGGGGGGGW